MVTNRFREENKIDIEGEGEEADKRTIDLDRG